MFIISAGAGLGNQMFEYAFYLKMQSVYKRSVIKLDTQYAFPKAHNGYEVERVFGLSSEKAALEEVRELADVDYLAFFGRRDKLLSRLRRKLKLHKNSFVMQVDFTEYYESFFDLNENESKYLYGPFANSRYFEDIKDEVLKAFTFPAPDKKTEEIARRISETTSVSIHLRRGDYVSDGVKLFGSEYYNRAIDRLSDITGIDKESMTFFVFSDDPGAAKSVFKGLENVYFIEGNSGSDSFRDMQLMSMCDHNIIVNSTFGFWGAYLNKNSNKVVIGTKKPFPGFKYPFTCDDWVLI
ncbi:MAG: alpha-1,2-fucosyltransferase [Lachnospiraceae bacterium]|nr:alpha-1,2-fucosyltransferase [Lachnospiraceae bacterium]